MAESTAKNEAPEGPLPMITRGAFRKGVVIATLVVVPGLSALLYLSSSDPLTGQLSHIEMLATVAIFAGLPAILVFGSIARNIVRLVNSSKGSGKRQGSILGALAGVGLAILAAIPTASLPSTIEGVVLTGVGAVLVGGLASLLLVLWIGLPIKRTSSNKLPH